MAERPSLIFLTSNGVGNAWIPAQIFGLRERGVPVELHTLHRPDGAFFRAEEIEALDRGCASVYPLPWLAFLGNLLHGLLRFAPRILQIAASLAAAPDPPGQRLRALLHLPIAIHFAMQMRGRVAHVHADMAHSPATIGLFAAQLLGVDFSFMGHANDLFQRRVALAHKVQQASAVLCISNFHRELYRSLGGAEEKLHVVHLGVDTARFPLAPDRREPVPHVLSSGRLVAKKGFPVLIEACSLLVQRGLALRCTIAGSGPLEAELRAQVSALSLDEVVKLTGEPIDQEDLPKFMVSGDLYCLPCVPAPDGDIDGLPVMLMEAMACGLPAISTRLAGIPDLIEAGRTGLLVPADDVAALADALAELIADRDRAREIGLCGRAFVQERFDVAVMQDRLCALFGRLQAGS